LSRQLITANWLRNEGWVFLLPIYFIVDTTQTEERSRPLKEYMEEMKLFITGDSLLTTPNWEVW